MFQFAFSLISYKQVIKYSEENNIIRTKLTNKYLKSSFIEMEERERERRDY